MSLFPELGYNNTGRAWYGLNASTTPLWINGWGSSVNLSRIPQGGLPVFNRTGGIVFNRPAFNNYYSRPVLHLGPVNIDVWTAGFTVLLTFKFTGTPLDSEPIMDMRNRDMPNESDDIRILRFGSASRISLRLSVNNIFTPVQLLSQEAIHRVAFSVSPDSLQLFLSNCDRSI
jgi:hypothetical protein